MKKRLSLILCVVLLCQLLSGCGKTTETVREPDDAYRCYYEIFVGSFCDSDGDGIGDFRGAEQKLDYLEKLGITGIWLMPINKSNSSPYSTIDYYGLNPNLGTMQDLKSFLSAAHERGIQVIMDLVVNHCAYNNPWLSLIHI